MDAVELERRGITKVVAQRMGMLGTTQNPQYQRINAQATGVGNFLMYAAGGARAVDATEWHALQNDAGIPYFMAGVDFIGDPCHPIFGG